jgi:beta-phosphoglucomutase-like phosphatase (HAD superfamily)
VAKQLKAVIFDVDGTLAETERDGHRVAFNRAFKKHDLDWLWDVDLYGQLLAVTGGKERIKYYLSNFNMEFDYQGNLDNFIANLHKDKTQFYVELLEQKAISLRPGVARLISEIRDAGITLAIATTTTPDNVSALLKSTLGNESIHWFSSIAAGDVVPAKKPAPDIFTHCLDELGLVAEECLAIEDSGNGLKAAVGAKLKTVVTCNAYTKGEDFSDAIAVFDQLGDMDDHCTQTQGAPINANFVSFQSLQTMFSK